MLLTGRAPSSLEEPKLLTPGVALLHRLRPRYQIGATGAFPSDPTPAHRLWTFQLISGKSSVENQVVSAFGWERLYLVAWGQGIDCACARLGEGSPLPQRFELGGGEHGCLSPLLLTLAFPRRPPSPPGVLPPTPLLWTDWLGPHGFMALPNESLPWAAS